jgi:hypothetical protein
MKVAMLSSFISFELDPGEELLAYEYTDLQVAGLQNELATSAEQLITAVMETDELSLEGAKKLAYTKGQIDILKYLLARADAIREQRAEEQAAKNNQ